MKWSLRRRMVVAATAAVVVLAGAVTIAWARRTAPPWPAVAGTAYQIPLGPDGCPVINDQYRFVDAPGELVPPGAAEVVLCTTPLEAVYPTGAGPVPQARQQVLRVGVADFTAALNRLPDRNTSWRQWQRRHSGWWPDAPPRQDQYLMIGCPYQSFVLRYPDRPPVPLISTCGTGGLTSGARTRIDDPKRGAVAEFLRRFAEQ